MARLMNKIFKSRNAVLTRENEVLLQERVELQTKLADLKIQHTQETEELKLKQKMAIEDIEHMHKKLEELRDLEFKKKEMELQKSHLSAIEQLKTDHHNAISALLMKNGDDIKKMYDEVLKRLPNLNARMKIE